MPKKIERREMVHVYLTSEEKAKTELEARKLGISLSSYIKVRLFSKNFAILMFLIVLGLVFSQSVSAEIDLMGLTMDIKESGVDVSSGNISIEIYDDSSARGNLSAIPVILLAVKTKELKHE